MFSIDMEAKMNSIKYGDWRTMYLLCKHSSKVKDNISKEDFTFNKGKKYWVVQNINSDGFMTIALPEQRRAIELGRSVFFKLFSEKEYILNLITERENKNGKI